MRQDERAHTGTRGSAGRVFDGGVVVDDVLKAGVRDLPHEVVADHRLHVRIGAVALLVEPGAGDAVTTEDH